MVVYILNCQGKPLMPCSSCTARKLLKSGKAVVKSRTPFVLKLKFPCANRVQEVVAGMDTGAETIGTAATSNSKSLYQSETILRSKEIKNKMGQRSMYRRTRRGRKTGYRKARFLNRRNSIKLNRLPPSVKHLVDSHLREKKFVESILPVTKWFVETASFDIHKITDQNVSKKNGWTYQQGRCKDFYNVKAYVLDRDKYSCQKCKSKTKNQHLHVHHIIFKSNGGTDSPDNLVTLCESCHKKIHLLKNGQAQKESKLLRTKAQKNTASATKVSIVKTQIQKHFGDFEETFGYITKFHREEQGLSKEHHVDALIIASQSEIVKPSNYLLLKKCVSKGDYKQTSGSHSEKCVPTGKLFGLRKFDKIKVGNICGFIKGKRSSGSFAISNLDGSKITGSINVKKNCTRISARKTILKTMKLAASSPCVKSGVSIDDDAIEAFSDWLKANNATNFIRNSVDVEALVIEKDGFYKVSDLFVKEIVLH
jgi:5-methylcytosine-specific restriction endonuclease McrA